MENFFLHFTKIKQMHHPFLLFRPAHILFLVGSIVSAVACSIWYAKQKEERKRHILHGFGFYFLIEELIFIAWVCGSSKDSPLLEVLPLQLCSLCVYMNVFSAFFQWDYTCAFSAVVGLFAGAIALVYPATVLNLYPVFSYRVINFFCLHAAFIAFSLIQFQTRKYQSYSYMISNTILMMLLLGAAVFVNMHLNTDYLFVGNPPKVPLIAMLWNTLGPILFFGVGAPLVLIGLQVLVLILIRKIYRRFHLKNGKIVRSGVKI